jgi:hypothetical protein
MDLHHERQCIEGRQLQGATRLQEFGPNCATSG